MNIKILYTHIKRWPASNIERQLKVVVVYQEVRVFFRKKALLVGSTFLATKATGFVYFLTFYLFFYLFILFFF